MSKELTERRGSFWFNHGEVFLEIKDIIRKASDLPSMPDVAFEVIRIADQAESSALNVANTLSRDPSLSARVLRLANSAFYGMSRTVSSVQDSVIVLGMRTTKSLSLVAASFPWLHVALKGKGLKPELLWNHCISCAHFSKVIAKKINGVDAELAFCIALLHDMGTVALYLTSEKEFNQLVLLAKDAETPFDQLERELLTFDHAELGAALAESWNLPKIYSEVIRYHHRPSQLDAPEPLTDILHIADILVRNRGISEGLDGTFYLRDQGAFDRIGIEPEILEAWLDEALAQLVDSDDDPVYRAA